MNFPELTTPLVLFPDRLCEMKPRQGGRHAFGGKGSAEFLKWTPRWPLPQLVFALDLGDPRLGLNQNDIKIPLYFPFQLDGGSLEYKVDETGKIMKWKSNGKPAVDWPYENYPTEFPIKTFEISKTVHVDWEKLAEDEDWTGITLQDSRPEKGEILLVIPNCQSVGDILWGPKGYSAGVQTIFRIHLEKLQVTAFSEID